MAKVPEYIKENIYRRVKLDLEPSRWVVHFKIGGSVAVGGVMSLFLCGQMGFGLSSLANSTHALLMHYGGFFGCTVVCGLVFALIPVVLLRLLSSQLQFIVFLKRERLVIIGWVLSFGLYLVFRNQQPDVFLVLALWGFPAIFSFIGFGWFVNRLSSIRLSRHLSRT